MMLQWSARFFQEIQNARRRRARVVALVWVRMGVGLGVWVGLDWADTLLVICEKKNESESTIIHIYAVSSEIKFTQAPLCKLLVRYFYVYTYA